MPNAKISVGLLLIIALTLAFVTLDPRVSVAAKQRIWVGTNSTWEDEEVTTSAKTVVSINIRKKKRNSLLRISFYGGRLSFATDVNDLNSQAVFSIVFDGVVIAESLNFDSAIGFRNSYPYISAVVNNAKKGKHTVSVTVSKTSNTNKNEGDLTYTTTIDVNPNTYKAYLTIEEWPKGVMVE